MYPCEAFFLINIIIDVVTS